MDKEELLNIIGTNIRKYRIQAELSQESLSLASNLSQQYVGKIERGERCPNIETLYKLCEELEISVSDLFIYNDSKSNSDLKITEKIEKTLEKIPENKKICLTKVLEDITELLE